MFRTSPLKIGPLHKMWLAFLAFWSFFLLSPVIWCEKTTLKGSQIKHGNNYIAAPFLYAATIARNLYVFKTSAYRDDIRRLKHSSSSLNVHLLGSSSYFDRYVTVFLLRLLFLVKIAEVHYGGEWSVHKLQVLYSTWLLVMLFGFVVI